MFVSLFIAALISFISVHSLCGVKSPTLCINQVTEPSQGFGDLTNQYAFAMQTFKDSVYVATLNAVNAPLGVAAFFFGIPFESKGASIYKGKSSLCSPSNTTCSRKWNWTPIASGGLGDTFNYGVRKFASVGNYLYAVTGNHVNGFDIWRTTGDDFEIVMSGGFGNVENTSGRGMGIFDGYLYIGVENRQTGAKMYRRKLDEIGDFAADSEWEVISSDGFGDEGNIWFSDITEYNGFIYTGTLNAGGMELWRSSDGVAFEQVFDGGNGFIGNTAAMKLYVYNDRLYVGTMNFFKGASLWVNDDEEGLDFVPVFVEGNGNSFNAYVWQMEEYNGRLYIGTFDMDGLISDFFATGFDLFSSKEALASSNDWLTETTTAFGNRGQYGLRSMAVIDGKLMIGSATAGADTACIVFEAKGTKKGYPLDAKGGEHAVYNATRVQEFICNESGLKGLAEIGNMCAI